MNGSEGKFDTAVMRPTHHVTFRFDVIPCDNRSNSDTYAALLEELKVLSAGGLTIRREVEALIKAEVRFVNVVRMRIPHRIEQ